ncbi:MAG TPA: XTP/dITP diphosphatase [Thermoanaerobacterales bacterium]|nr:XTP/dITP diphosphatase [Thermoanaerobacterales bacterium]
MLNRAKTNRIVVASRNKGKLIEIKEMLKDTDIEVVSVDDFYGIPRLVEDGQTFEENALCKARAISQILNMTALADDSGLEVDFLKGLPGVKSARFAGEHANDEENNKKLLRLLEGVPFEDRKARFRCVIAMVCSDGREYKTEGFCDGYITLEPRGSNGFGYDPIFWIPEFNMTFGEMEPGIKNNISHRAKALSEMVKIIKREII